MATQTQTALTILSRKHVDPRTGLRHTSSRVQWSSERTEATGSPNAAAIKQDGGQMSGHGC